MPWHLINKNPNGAFAEKMALRYLKKNGLKRIDCNFATPYGELDIIMLDSSTLVFIEVRFRTLSRFGSALASITPIKCMKIRKTAQNFLQHNPGHNHRQCRFDIVTVNYNKATCQSHLQWIKGAF